MTVLKEEIYNIIKKDYKHSLDIDAITRLSKITIHSSRVGSIVRQLCEDRIIVRSEKKDGYIVIRYNITPKG